MFEVWLSGLLTNTVQVPASLASFNQWLSWLLETAGPQFSNTLLAVTTMVSSAFSQTTTMFARGGLLTALGRGVTWRVLS